MDKVIPINTGNYDTKVGNNETFLRNAKPLQILYFTLS